MKLTNCLSILLTVFFVMSLLSSTHAGQKGVVVSPATEGAKVEPDISKTAPKKVVPQKVEPKAVPGGTSVLPKKKKVEIKEPQKATPRVKCNGKVVTILGTSGDDFLNGTQGPDVIHGLGGNDIIRGMGGDDIICGGDGDDKLDGGKGNDILDGGPGRDECINGPSGKGVLVAPKNCENKKLPPTVGISPKTQRKPVVTSGGFVPAKPAQKAQLETQKQFEAKQKAFVVQPDTMKPRSGDTSMGKTMLKPSNAVTFQTHLSVKLPDDKWGTEYKETEWQYLKFRWRTPIGDSPIYGKWEISMSPYFNTVIFDGDAGRVSESGQYQWFYIDFKNVTEQYANLNRVYVRVVPITESKLYAPSSPVPVSIIEPGHFEFDFIADVAVQPHGTYVRFFVTTTDPAKLKLRTYYSKKPPFSAGECDEFVDHSSWMIKSTFALGWQTQWEAHIGDLIPEHTYGWILCAEDKDGQHTQKSGTFKTLKRRVEVTFTEVDIIDDSDELSAGECKFSFFLTPLGKNLGEHEPSVEQRAIFPGYYDPLVTCDSGETVTLDPAVVFTWIGGIEYAVKINGTVVEMDGGYGVDYSTCKDYDDLKPIESGHIDDACAERTGQTVTFDLRPPGLLDENIYKPFQIHAGSGLEVIFHGYLRVEYIK